MGQQETEEYISQQDSNNEESRDTQHDILEDNNEEVGTTAPKEKNEEVVTTAPKNIYEELGTTAPKFNNKEVGTTAPKYFYPPRLLAIMVIGVLSNEMEKILGYIEENIYGENVAAGLVVNSFAMMQLLIFQFPH